MVAEFWFQRKGEKKICFILCLFLVTYRFWLPFILFEHFSSVDDCGKASKKTTNCFGSLPVFCFFCENNFETLDDETAQQHKFVRLLRGGSESPLFSFFFLLLTNFASEFGVFGVCYIFITFRSIDVFEALIVIRVILVSRCSRFSNRKKLFLTVSRRLIEEVKYF